MGTFCRVPLWILLVILGPLTAQEYGLGDYNVDETVDYTIDETMQGQEQQQQQKRPAILLTGPPRISVIPVASHTVVKAINAAHNNRVCSTWGNFNFKNFDGDIFHFPGTCNYIFASHCKSTYEDFSIQIRRSVVNKLPVIERITMKIDGLAVVINKNTVSVNDKVVQLPFSGSGIQIEKHGVYLTVTSKLGMVFMWNDDDSLLLELDEKFANQTCGLCGDYNGISIHNEFISNGIQITESQFGNLQKLDGPTEQCADVPPVPKSNCTDHENICESILLGSAFSSCHSLVAVEQYIEACVKDLCRCDSKNTALCLCDTFAEYSRQCAHAGGEPANWRTKDLCPKTCPFNMQYQECGSPCADSCSNPERSVLCENHCLEGCFCPPGTVFDDLNNSGCIPLDKCSCTFNSNSYAAGTSFSSTCSSCACIGGKWKCENFACPATCSIDGGSHITTYDQSHYDIHGDCNYVLTKDCKGSSFIILTELRKCGLTESETCLKSATLILNGETIVVIKPCGSVFVNNLYTRLPMSAANVTIFRPSSFYIVVQTNLGVQLVAQLIPFMQVYVVLDPSYKGQTCGLCGNFNDKQTDEFQTINGVIEGTAASFANTWKTQADCANIKNVYEDPCSLSIENEQYAQHWCGLISDPSGPFAACHATVNPDVYQTNCMFDTCNCEKSEECMCASLSSYVLACATKEIIMEGWRTNVCFKYMNNCPKTQIYTYSTSTCQPTCRSLSEPDVTCSIKFPAVDGCTCAKNFYLDDSGKCVPAETCPCYFKGSTVPSGETIHENGIMCTCSQGKLSCIGTITPTCTAPMVYLDCKNVSKGTKGAECQKSCQTLDMACYSAKCISGCVCPEGLVSDGKGGCIKEEQCPCIHNDAIYQPGEKITMKCNTCTCKDRMWQCTNNPCLATCAVYGDGHYITFDGKRYNFNGDCEYVLAQDHCGKGGNGSTFRVITENIPCGTTGATCSKSIKVFMGSYELILTEEHIEVLERGIGGVAPYKVRHMGIYLVIEADNGLILMWDRRTSLFLKLSKDFEGKVCGLCGDYDGNGNNDFTTRSLSVVGDVFEFANSWKVSSTCPDAKQPKDACRANPYRKSWAQKQCSILNSKVFSACHAQVDVSKYYDACVEDACACDSGGDCECFCTAVAAYAQVCGEAGVCVSWRTPRICPLFCDYYNPQGECEWHYKPCGAPCMKTCRNPSGKCMHELSGLEGCYPSCPAATPFFDEDDMECVAQCGCYDDEGKHYKVGQSVPTSENCKTCNCKMSGIECKYQKEACQCEYQDKMYHFNDVIYNTTDGIGGCISAICKENGTIYRDIYNCKVTTTIGTPFTFTSTHPTTTETKPPVTTICVKEVCKWSQWFDASYPEPGIQNGDFDTYDKILAKGYSICKHPQDIQCRAEMFPDTPLAELEQNVQCNVSFGLICQNSQQLPPICYNYEIRVLCCSHERCDTTPTTTHATTKPPSTTQPSTTTHPTTRPSTSIVKTTSAPTTPVSTTTSNTPTVCHPKCTWTEWLDVHLPGVGKDEGDYETYEKIIAEGHRICKKPDGIQCRSEKYPKVPIGKIGQVVQCNLTFGLVCKNEDQEGDFKVCLNYQIKVLCCDDYSHCGTPVPATTTETTTALTTTPVPPTTTETTTPTTTPVPPTTTETTTPLTTTPVPPTTTETTTPTTTPVPPTTTETTTPLTTTPVPPTTTETTTPTTTPVPPTTTETTTPTTTPVPPTTTETTTPLTTTPVPPTTTETTTPTTTPVPPTTTETTTPITTTTPVPPTTTETTTPITTTPVPPTTTETTTTPTTIETTTTSTTTTTVPPTTTETTTTSTTVSTTTTPETTTTTTTETPETTTPETIVTRTFTTPKPTTKKQKICEPQCKWSTWIDVDIPTSGIDGGDKETFENIMANGKHVCRNPQNIECRAADYPGISIESIGQKVQCDVTIGLVCNNKDQVGDVKQCYNYQIKVLCCDDYSHCSTAPPPTTTPTTTTTTTETPTTTTTTVPPTTTETTTETTTTTTTVPPTTTETTTPTTTTTETTTTTTTTPVTTTTTTTPETTTTPATPTPTPDHGCQPKCKWTPWIDVDTPTSGIDGGDKETFQNIIAKDKHICKHPQNIECRAEDFPDITIDNIGQVVTCDLTKGLVCNNKDQPGKLKQCYNYQIKVLCCDDYSHCSTAPPQTTTPATTTTTTTTPSTTTTTETPETTTTTTTVPPTTSETTTTPTTTTTTETTTTTTTTPVTTTTETTTPTTTTTTETTTPVTTTTTETTTTPTTTTTTETTTTTTTTPVTTTTTTTPETTTTPATTTTTPDRGCQPKCKWTPWIDVDTPTSGIDGGDKETFENIIAKDKHICKHPQNIECRAEDFPDITIGNIGQVVTCDLIKGLVCNNKDQTGKVKLCYNYQIKVLCCDDYSHCSTAPPQTTTHATTTTPTTTTTTETPETTTTTTTTAPPTTPETATTPTTTTTTETTTTTTTTPVTTTTETTTPTTTTTTETTTTTTTTPVTTTTTTTPETTTTPATTTPTPDRGCQPKCKWTTWIDVDTPTSGIDGGDKETFQNIIAKDKHICKHPQNIECRAEDFPDITIGNIGQVVTCDLTKGLVCNNKDQIGEIKLCFNYQIKVLCCDDYSHCSTAPPQTTTHATTTTPSTTTTTETPETITTTTTTAPTTKPETTTTPTTTTTTETTTTTTTTPVTTTTETTTPTTTTTTETTTPVTTTTTETTTTPTTTTTTETTTTTTTTPVTTTTTPETTTTPATTTPDRGCQPKCKWTTWIDVDTPTSGIDGGDKESFQNIIAKDKHICKHPQNIECRAEDFPDITIDNIGQVVTCDLTKGLVCNNKDQTGKVKLCYNYQIKVLCCDDYSHCSTAPPQTTTHATTTTPSTTTTTETPETTTTTTTTAPTTTPETTTTPTTTTTTETTTTTTTTPVTTTTTTTPETTTTPATTTPTPDRGCQPKCQWSTWIDVDTPTSGIDGGDNETFENIIAKDIHICKHPQNIECRAEDFPDITIGNIGQVVTCDTTKGLECNNKDQIGLIKLCLNYQIKVLCCDDYRHCSTAPPQTTTHTTTTTPTTTTTETTTTTTTTPETTTTTTPETTTTPATTTPDRGCQPKCQWSTWIDVDTPTSGIDGGDNETFKNIIANDIHICKHPQNIECRAEDFPDITIGNIGQVVTCDTTKGLECNNKDQIGLIKLCLNYQIKVLCCDDYRHCSTAPPQTTTPATTTTTQTTTTAPTTTTTETTTTATTTTPETTTTTTTPETTTTTTTPETTTTPATTTPTPDRGCQPKCKWTTWIDVDTPTSGIDGGDKETFQNIIAKDKHICKHPQNIECRAEDFPDITIDNIGQVVTCDLTKGLVCNNKDQTGEIKLCYNYQIKVLCCDDYSHCSTAPPQTTTPATTTTTTTQTTTTTTPTTTTTTTPVPTTTTKPTTTTPETTHTTKCFCRFDSKLFLPGQIIYNKTDAAGCIYYAVCNDFCEAERFTGPCRIITTTVPTTTTPEKTTTTTEPTTTTPEKTTTTTVPTTTTPEKTTTTTVPTTTTPEKTTTTTVPTTTTPEKTTPLEGCPPHKTKETWLINNCTVATCHGNNVITIEPVSCPKVKPLSCANGFPPVKKMSADGCCEHYECECVCSGWGDPHYITFDGTYYTFLDNCTYILMQQITPKYDNFRVLVDNYFCDAEDGLSCPQSILIYYKSNEIVLTRMLYQGKMNNRIRFNQEWVTPGFTKDGITVTSAGINMIVEIPEIDAFISFSGLIFVIKLPFSKFGHNTEGQCGTCSNNSTEDCRMPDGKIVKDCSKMAYHWKVNVKDKPYCNLPSPTLPPNVPTTPPPTCPPSALCDIILSDVFAECHKVIPPKPYHEGCVFDACRIRNDSIQCSSLEIYATLCSANGVCVNWRNKTKGHCPYHCPAGKVYNACGTMHAKTCESKEVEHLSTGYTEGCYCPKGTTLFNSYTDVCVKSCSCVGPEGMPKGPGETWTSSCKECICEKNSLTVQCKAMTCPPLVDIPCKKEGFIIETLPDPEQPCCMKNECYCNSTYCVEKEKKCATGFEAVPVLLVGDCCPSYDCRPLRVCVFDEIMYKPGTTIPQTKQSCTNCVCTDQRNNDTLLLEVQCKPIECKVECGPATELVTSDGDCCGKCEPVACIVKAKDGTTTIVKPGETYKPADQPCVKTECHVIDDQYVPVEVRRVCTIEECPVGSTYKTQPGECCGTCVPVACVIHLSDNTTKLLQPEEQYTPPEDKCSTFSCSKTYDVVKKTETCPAFDRAKCLEGSIKSDGCCETCETGLKGCGVHKQSQRIKTSTCESDEVVELSFCGGACMTSSKYSAEAKTMEHQCSCCQEVKTSKRQVNLKCVDGTSTVYTYIYTEECGCTHTECQNDQQTSSSQQHEKVQTEQEIDQEQQSQQTN